MTGAAAAVARGAVLSWALVTMPDAPAIAIPRIKVRRSSPADFVGIFVSDILSSLLNELQTRDAARQAIDGWLGSRLTHRNAGTEFFQKNFSAAGCPFAMK
jgi:hypothetical protein